MCVVTLTDKDMEKADVSLTVEAKGIRLTVKVDGDTYIDQYYLYKMNYLRSGYDIVLYNVYGGGQIGDSAVKFNVQSSGYSFSAKATGIEHTHPIIAGKLLNVVMNGTGHADKVILGETTKNKYGEYESANYSFVSSYVEEDEYADIDG